MKTYLNKQSGISHYQIGDEFIKIKFKTKSFIYRYTYKLSGEDHIEQMKILAKEGYGLATYINQHPAVRDRFEVVKK